MKDVNLYELLQVEKNAAKNKIKKAYFALAKKVHPDKNRDDPKANENFHALQKAYEILYDEKKRERYDRTGCSEEDSEAFWNAYERFRGVKVTQEDIEQYVSEYKNSKGEENDLLQYINSHAGDITIILSSIIASENEDIQRYIKFFEQEFKAGNIDKKYEKTFNRTKTKVMTAEQLDEIEDDEVYDEEDAKSTESTAEDMDDFIVNDESHNSNQDLSDSDSSDGEERKDQKLSKGTNVRVRWKGGIKYYAAKVSRVRKKNKFDVKYSDGAEEENVDRNFIKICKKKPEDLAEKENKLPEPKSKKRKRNPTSNKSKKVDDMESLKAAILGKNKNRKDQFDAFARKYAGK